MQPQILRAGSTHPSALRLWTSTSCNAWTTALFRWLAALKSPLTIGTSSRMKTSNTTPGGHCMTKSSCASRDVETPNIGTEKAIPDANTSAVTSGRRLFSYVCTPSWRRYLAASQCAPETKRSNCTKRGRAAVVRTRRTDGQPDRIVSWSIGPLATSPNQARQRC